MWTDRFTVYYSKEKAYAVRWLKHGQAEDEAQYKKFEDKILAERFYNGLVAEDPELRVEIFFSQAKWVAYHGNHDEFGELKTDPIGESAICLNGDHEDCSGPLASVCTCPCHSDLPNGSPR